MPLILVPGDGISRRMWYVLDFPRYCLKIVVIVGLLFAPLHICLSSLTNRFLLRGFYTAQRALVSNVVTSALFRGLVCCDFAA
jgi:hypothetical protein